MSEGVAAANLGLTVQALSDLLIIDSNLSDVQSDLIIVQSDLKTVLSNIVSFRSDIIATTDSDIVVIQSNLTVAKSDIVVIISDVALIPKTGTAVSTASGTTTGVIVQDSITGTPDVVSVTTSATANIFGSWTNLDASVSANSWMAGFTVLPDITTLAAGVDPFKVCVEIGTGASPTTKIRVSFSFVYDTTAAGVKYAHAITFICPIPIKVASGTAISARASLNVADAGGMILQIGLSMYQSLE